MTYEKVDSLPGFPRSAVHPDTEACLTSEFEMGSGDPRPYGRPESLNYASFKKIWFDFRHKVYIGVTTPKDGMTKDVSLEQFMEDCQRISSLVDEAVQNSNLPYISGRGLRSGVKIMDDVTKYFRDPSQRKPEDDASVLQMAGFGLQTLRDGCMIAEEECGQDTLHKLRAIINTVGEYSIKTGDLQYSFQSGLIPRSSAAIGSFIF